MKTSALAAFCLLCCKALSQTDEGEVTLEPMRVIAKKDIISPAIGHKFERYMDDQASSPKKNFLDRLAVSFVPEDKLPSSVRDIDRPPFFGKDPDLAVKAQGGISLFPGGTLYIRGGLGWRLDRATTICIRSISHGAYGLVWKRTW